MRGRAKFSTRAPGRSTRRARTRGAACLNAQSPPPKQATKKAAAPAKKPATKVRMMKKTDGRRRRAARSLYAPRLDRSPRRLSCFFVPLPAAAQLLSQGEWSVGYYIYVLERGRQGTPLREKPRRGVCCWQSWWVGGRVACGQKAGSAAHQSRAKEGGVPPPIGDDQSAPHSPEVGGEAAVEARGARAHKRSSSAPLCLTAAPPLVVVVSKEDSCVDKSVVT